MVACATGEILHANRAAERFEFAYREVEGWSAVDERGRHVASADLPHHRATRGECFGGHLVHFASETARYSLRFHCHLLASTGCLLTFDDVTAFEDTRRELEAALRSRDELVSLAAHELRSPLGTLQLAAERIQSHARGDGGELSKMAKTAVRQTRRLGILVSNMLDVSRIRTGAFELDREPCELAEIVEEACESLAEQAAAAGKPLDVVIAERGAGDWDRVRMEQALVNLVVNAIKYGDAPIQVRLSRVDNDFELCVADHGAGIPAEAQPRLFRAYERASSRHAAQSLGLGLFIVREVVAAHGGTVEVASHPGETVFRLLLPRNPSR